MMINESNVKGSNNNKLRRTPVTSTRRTVLVEMPLRYWQAIEEFPHPGFGTIGDRLFYCVQVAMGEIPIDDTDTETIAVDPVSDDTRNEYQ